MVSAAAPHNGVLRHDRIVFCVPRSPNSASPQLAGGVTLWRNLRLQGGDIMADLFGGLTVLDLSNGIAGPCATMMLADRGADVIRIEGPEPDDFPALDNGKVWNRGKRSAIVDLTKPQERELFLKLAANADVLVESFAPGRTRELGIDFETLTVLNPKLIYCSITGYGRGNKHSSRPAYDQLVAARTGLQWEARGWYGSPMAHIQGRDRQSADFPVPAEVRIGADRDGPIFTASPAPSVITTYHTLLGISAALCAREQTGLGQWVETSMLQAVIAMNCAGWQRPERLDSPGYDHEVMERRQTWGIVEAKDGFMCMWVSPPAWFSAAGEGDALKVPDPTLRDMRKVMMPIEQRLQALKQAAPIFKKFTVEEWVRIAAQDGNVSCQPVRKPEEALSDPALLAEGSVVEVEDPELGTLLQAGAVYRMSNRPIHVRWPAPKRGAHTEAVKAEARALEAKTEPPATEGGKALQRPLGGVRIVDFGAAVAGPWATQLLADLGADVIKVDPARQAFWLVNHMALTVNRSKRWMGLDAKTSAGAEIVRRLVQGADVVVLNIRPRAARKLGLDYETLSQINSTLIYCHTRGHEDGPRSSLPGNDQTGNALGGAEFEDGGTWNGGRPWFGSTSNGDLGNGYLAAIGIVQALYDRSRTGKGQMVDASILNASLVNCSRVYTDRNGTRFPRPKLDCEQTGLSALYSLYACADGEWICIGVFSDAVWQALTAVVPALGSDARFASPTLRAENDAALRQILGEAFRCESAREMFTRLDQAGVACEISSRTFSQTLFDDPEMIERKWVARCRGNPNTGTIDMFGIPIDFSRTATEPGGAPPVLWQHTRVILLEMGYSDAQIDALAKDGVIILPAHDLARRSA
jgi:crotonobetainyl-CoA:carnitine CoA-transferase CaiB-like acyl-CoA transferase